jgi:hypothetical protein
MLKTIKENKDTILELIKGLVVVTSLFIALEIIKNLIIHLAF